MQRSGKEDPLLGPPPLRTVRETLISYGSSMLRTTCDFRSPIVMRLLVAEQMHQYSGPSGIISAGCRIFDVVNAERFSVIESFTAYRAFPSLHAGQTLMLDRQLTGSPSTALFPVGHQFGIIGG